MRRSHSTITMAATGLCALALGITSSAAHAAPPEATAVATFGSSEVWLAPDPGSPGRRLLAYAARPGDPGMIIAVRIRPSSGFGSDGVALGTDGWGRRVAVFTMRDGLGSVPVSGGAPRRLPFSAAKDTGPSVLGGRVGFVRGGDRVMVAGYTRSMARTVARTTSDSSAFVDTAVGAGGSVAWVRYLESEAPRYRVELRAPGRAVKRLHELRTDATVDGGLALTGISTNGRVLSVAARQNEQLTELQFALPGGGRR